MPKPLPANGDLAADGRSDRVGGAVGGTLVPCGRTRAA